MDRELELAAIARHLARTEPVLAIVYGRRGAGKSRLLEHALMKMTHFWYTATTRVLTQQLEDMRVALTALPTKVVIAGTPGSIEEILNILALVADERRPHPFPIVIDELPYLADADPGLLTSLQRWWKEQERLGRSNLKLFLLGSRVSWMQREAMSEDAALMTVRDVNLEVHEFSYRDSAAFYPSFDPHDRVRSWSVWGGLPTNLEAVDPDQSFWSNVERMTLDRSAKLYAEPDWLRYTELRSDALYSSVVRAIASGARVPSDIARAVGKKSASEVVPRLASLVDARIVSRRPSLVAEGEEERTAVYVLADSFLSYWYRFVDPQRSLLERGLMRPVLRRLQDSEYGLDKYVSEQPFEDVCRSFLFEARASDRLPEEVQFDRVGSWWYSRRGESDELDIVTYEGKRMTALGECKWSSEPMGESDVERLERIRSRYAADLRPHPVCYRLLFSKNGFARGLRERARDERERILLFEPKDLYW